MKRGRICLDGPLTQTGLPGDLLGDVRPQVGGVWIRNTTSTAVRLECAVNFTNPTPHTASIPFANVYFLSEDCILGDVTVQNLVVTEGNVTNVAVSTAWDPAGFGGDASRQAGRRLLSDYLSGRNTSITIRTHRHSIPSLPALGEALSRIPLTLPLPRMRLPGDDADPSSVIRDAVFHMLTSSATFTLASPLEQNTVHIDAVRATALYNHTEPVARIEHDSPFQVPPGVSETPRMGVAWSYGSVGYGRMREVLGGSMRLDAEADVDVRMGNWRETVRYEGRGIGVRVRL